MSVVVSCRCGGQFQASPDLYGKQLACPNCGSSLMVPQGPIPTLTPLGQNPQQAPVQQAPVQGGPSHPIHSQAHPQQHAPQPSVYSAGGHLASKPVAAPQHRRRGSGGLSTGATVGLFVLGGMLLIVGGIGYLGYQAYRSVRAAVVGDNLDLRNEDFALAHKAFHTELTEKGKSPQQYSPLTTPPGAEAIEYNSKRGNLRLKAFVDPAPADGAVKPAVLFLHGGFAFGDGDWEMAKPFRDAGYVVMTPVLRAENGQPGVFTLYHHEVDDVIGALNKLKSLPYVDSKRIYVSGHSAGGTLAALAAMASSDIRAAASLCGCMNQTLNADIAPYSSSNLDEVSIRSPLAYAASFKCPTRLFYGDQEFLLRGANEATATRAKSAGLDVAAQSVVGDHFSAVPYAMQGALKFFASKGGPVSTYSPPPPSSGRVANTPNVRLPKINIPTSPSFDPPTTYKPPTFKPPTFEPPTFDPPTIPGRTDPFGSGRSGPSFPGRTGPTIPGRTGPSIPGRVGPSRSGPNFPSRPGSSRVGPSGLNLGPGGFGGP